MAAGDKQENGNLQQGIECSYLALGDSYTIGEGVTPEETFPFQLTSRLSGYGIPISSPQIVARTGWTSAELLEAIKGRPDFDQANHLVTLLIGVNDQYRGYAHESYRNNFRELLAISSEFAGGNKERVMVLSIPDWGVTPFAAGRDREEIAAQIAAFNRINREESSRAGIAYVDITPISRQAEGNNAMLASDGLHPSAKMYSLWASKLVPAALDILNAP